MHARQFQCKICEFSTDSLEHLRKHETLHSKQRRYPCTQCDKAFLRKDHLKRHLHIHSGEMPFVCTICGKGFVQSQDMSRHKEIHSTQDANYPCDICNEVLLSKPSLRNHKKLHSSSEESQIAENIVENNKENKFNDIATDDWNQLSQNIIDLRTCLPEFVHQEVIQQREDQYQFNVCDKASEADYLSEQTIRNRGIHFNLQRLESRGNGAKNNDETIYNDPGCDITVNNHQPGIADLTAVDLNQQSAQMEVPVHHFENINIPNIESRTDQIVFAHNSGTQTTNFRGIEDLEMPLDFKNYDSMVPLDFKHYDGMVMNACTSSTPNASFIEPLNTSGLIVLSNASTLSLPGQDLRNIPMSQNQVSNLIVPNYSLSTASHLPPYHCSTSADPIDGLESFVLPRNRTAFNGDDDTDDILDLSGVDTEVIASMLPQ